MSTTIIIADTMKTTNIRGMMGRIGVWTFISLGFVQTADTPTLFLIGDSISIQYGPYFERYVQGTIEVDRKRDDGGSPDERVPDGPNGGDSRMVLAYLKSRLADPAFEPDVLLLNCGLHDIKKDVKTQQNQVSIQEYEQNLEAILNLVGERRISLIWIRTTQVVDSIHNARERLDFARFASDQIAYNAVADRVFSKAGVFIIDLYEFTMLLSDDRFIDHVHYNEETRELQGAYLAGAVKAWLAHHARRENSGK